MWNRIVRQWAKWRTAGAEKKRMSIFCDGSSQPTRGLPGGWAFALVCDGRAVVTRSGAFTTSTSNLMELHAALAGLREVLSRGCHRRHDIELVSDSRVTLDVAEGRYMPPKHRDLCELLRAAFLEARAKTRWVKGHSGEPWNETVDALAAQAKLALVPARVRRRAAARRALMFSKLAPS